jgi:hypothetical protein
MRILPVVALATLIGRGDLRATPMPELYGFDAKASSTHADPALLVRMRSRATNESCGAGGIAVRGRVTGDAQIVVASFDRVLVVDRVGAIVASARSGFTCNADDGLDAIAIGSAPRGAPMIAVAQTTADDRTTYVTLYRVRDRELVRSFSGAVESREGVDIWYGSIRLLPNGLLYRPPGDPVRWLPLDTATGRYVDGGARANS